MRTPTFLLAALTASASTCSSPRPDPPETNASGEAGRTPVAGGRVGAGGAGGAERPVPPDAAASSDASADERRDGFVCTEVLGIGLTSEWYLAGFEDDGVDGARWQLRWTQGALMDVYADPNAPAWRAPAVSPCASASDAPDRVLFVAWSWTIHDAGTWQTTLERAVATVRAKRPSARAVELLTIVRGPGNAACGGPNATESTQVPPYADEAAAAVAAASGGVVRTGPRVEAPSCASFRPASPYLTAEGNADVARIVAGHYR